VTTPLRPDEAEELLAEDELPLLRPPEPLAPLLALPLNEPPPLLPLDGADVGEGLLLLEGVGVGVGLPVGLTVKVAALVAVPPGAVTLTGPLVAPKGTVAVICVSLFTLKVAALPLKATTVAPVKPLPTRVTLLPTVPSVGIKAVIAGAASSAKLTAPVLMAAKVVRLSLLTAGVRLDATLVAETAAVDEVLAVEPLPVELLLDELLADEPPSAMVVTPLVEANVKSAWTDWAMVPVEAVAVR
jgi:hypothetical protein